MDFFCIFVKNNYMEGIDTLRAQYGARQLQKTGIDIESRFHTFITDEGTVLNAIYVIRDGVEVDVLDELTDDNTADFIIGAVFRCFKGDIFTKVNIASGRIVAYLEPNS